MKAKFDIYYWELYLIFYRIKVHLKILFSIFFNILKIFLDML